MTTTQSSTGKDNQEKVIWTNGVCKIIADGGLYYKVFPSNTEVKAEIIISEENSNKPLIIIGGVPLYFLPLNIPVSDTKIQVNLGESPALLGESDSEAVQKVKAVLKGKKAEAISAIVISKNHEGKDIAILLDSQYKDLF